VWRATLLRTSFRATESHLASTIRWRKLFDKVVCVCVYIGDLNCTVLPGTQEEVLQDDFT